MQELSASSRVIAEQPAGGDGDRVRAQRPHPAPRHAQMLSHQQNTHPAAMQLLLQEGGDLLPEFLLDLNPGGERLNSAGQFRQARDPLTGQHTHLGDTGERQQMMGADRGERHIPG